MTDARRVVLDLGATSKNWALPPEVEQQVRAATPPGWEVVTVSAPTSSDGDGPELGSEEAVRQVAEAEVYFGFGFTKDLYAAARRLRWIHSAAAGVGTMLTSGVEHSDILLTNSAGIHGAPIAEFVVATVLHFMRGLDLAIAQQAHRQWSKALFVADGSPLREVSGARVLIIGTGGLGSETARRLTALGAHCTGLRRRPALGAPEGFAQVFGIEALDDRLPDADVLVLAAPLTGQTGALVGRSRLERLPRGAIVVNVARGALLDDDAVADLLESGHLRGAALDVFRTEPLPRESRLWQIPGMLVVPHVSPVSPGRFWPRQLDLFCDNWRRYVTGQPLRNLVDKQAGY